PLPLEFNRLVVSLGYNALIGRKLAVDHSRYQHPSPDLEKQMILAALKLHVSLALEQELAQLEERLLRQDHAYFLAHTTCVIRRYQCQPMSVGRHERDAVWLQHELRAVQKIARVFAGNRKLCLRDHLLQHTSRKRR